MERESTFIEKTISLIKMFFLVLVLGGAVMFGIDSMRGDPDPEPTEEVQQNHFDIPMATNGQMAFKDGILLNIKSYLNLVGNRGFRGMTDQEMKNTMSSNINAIIRHAASQVSSDTVFDNPEKFKLWISKEVIYYLNTIGGSGFEIKGLHFKLYLPLASDIDPTRNAARKVMLDKEAAR